LGLKKLNKVFNSDAMSMYPLPKGFIIIAKKSDIVDKLVVSYKLISFENGTMSPVTKGVFQLAKFGNNFKTFEMQVPNYVTCKIASLDNQRLFVVTPDGIAKVMDHDGYAQWQGTMKYKGFGPTDIAVQGHTLWAAFTENNALIRFNLRTMREELRIGGSNDSAFNKPQGLWINKDANTMLVCNTGANSILEVNLKSYTVYEYAQFEEPVHQYMKILSNEIVLLDSGIYKL